MTERQQIANEEGRDPIIPDDPSASLVKGADTLSTTLKSPLPTFSIWNIGVPPDTEAPPSTAAAPPLYDLNRLVAKGGCGEIWEARQKSLDRIVAVKKIDERLRNEASLSKIKRWRLEHEFRLEAVTTARLDHPNIVPVYDLGADANGWPLMTMKLVKGDPWHHILRRDFTTLPLQDYLAKHLPIFISMMQAVAFAHSRGIVHRDLKPSQVMIGEFGEVLLMDWGFAISLADSMPQEPVAEPLFNQELPTPATASNPSGTPFFMAPEQTSRTAANISFLTDIYLLGGTLYFVLTGNYPHRAATSNAAIDMAARGEILPIERAAPGIDVPTELAALALHALAPDPHHRIQTVTELIERVKLYLSGASNRSASRALTAEVAHSIAAHLRAGNDTADSLERLYETYAATLNTLGQATTHWPQNPEIPSLRRELLDGYIKAALRGEDLTLARSLLPLLDDTAHRDILKEHIHAHERNARRNALQRRVAIAAAITLAILHLVGSFAYIQQQRRAQERIARERDIATEARTDEQKARVTAEAARRDAQEQQRIAEEARRAAEAEQYYANIGVAEAALQQDRAQKARDILLDKSPELFRHWEWGRLLALTATEDLSITRRDATHAIFSPDSSLIYTGDRDGTLSTWDARTGRLLRAVTPHKGRIWDVQPSHDGTRLLTSSFDKTACILDAHTGQILHRLEGHTDVLRTGAFSPDSTRVVTTSHDKTARTWDAATGAPLLTISQFTNAVYDASFSPDGTRLLTAARDRTARLWDANTGQLLLDLPGATESVLSARYSPDGTRILTSSTDRKLRLYNAQTGEIQLEILNPNSYFHSATFSPDGRLIAGATDDGIGRLWDANTGSPLADFKSDGPMWKANFSPDGRSLLTAARASVRLWNTNTLLGKPTRLDPTTTESPNPDDIFPIFGLPRGRDVAWLDRDNTWDHPNGRNLIRTGTRLIALDSRFDNISPDMKYRVHIDRKDYYALVHDANTGALVKQLPRVPIATAPFSPDATTLALVEPVDRVTLLDTANWQPRHVLRMDPDKNIKNALELYIAATAAFSPDGHTLLVVYLNGKAVLWDVATGHQIHETPKTTGLGVSAAFSPDGRLYLIAGNDDRITLWDAPTATLLRTFIGHTRPPLGASFSPDGRRIVSFSRDHTVKLWETHTGREILTVSKCEPSDTLLLAQFTHDGRALCIATASGQFQCLEAFPWNPIDYPNPEHTDLNDRIELWKRRQRLSPNITLQDVLQTPP